jgi:hypothetical protein
LKQSKRSNSYHNQIRNELVLSNKKESNKTEERQRSQITIQYNEEDRKDKDNSDILGKTMAGLAESLNLIS